MTAKTRLIPIFGTEKDSRIADIVFVHGLGGDPLSTWHSEGKKEKINSWMTWLAEDFLKEDRKELGVWSIGYEVEPFKWRGGTMPLADRAINIVELLDEYDLGEKPIIFVTHSMGGLVVKQMLRHAQDFGNPGWKKIVGQTKGIVFLSTPHSGSDIANWLKYIGGVLGKSVSVTELEANDSRLLELNEVYRNHEVLSQIPIKVYCETEATYKTVIVVDKTSANPGIPGATPIPLEKNHLNIAKPESREDRPYRGVKKFIKEKLRQPLPPLKMNEPNSQPDREIKVEKGNYIENIEGNYIKVEGNYIHNQEPKKKD